MRTAMRSGVETRKSMPKRNVYLKKDVSDPIDAIIEKDRINIVQTLNAIEGYVLCCCIAMGMLQLLAITYSERNNGVFDMCNPPQMTCHLRTP
jgi:hypothetical protein